MRWSAAAMGIKALFMLATLCAAAGPGDALAAMEKPLASFEANALPLDKAISKLAKEAGGAITLDTPRLRQAGQAATSPVNVRLTKTTAAAALAAILDQAAPDHALAFTWNDRGALVTVNRHETDVFDIRDLLAPAEKTGDPLARDAAVKHIIERLTSTVSPASWGEEHFAEIRVDRGRLHVRQNLFNLTDISRSLYYLRTEPPSAATSPPAALVLDDRGRDALVETRLRTLKITARSSGTFGDAIAALQKATDLSILPNWKALEAAGIHRTQPVTLNVQVLELGKALTEVLLQLPGAKGKIAFTVDDGAVTVSTAEDFESEKYQIIKIYDVRDLVGIAPDAGGKRMQALVETLETFIKPGTWNDKGGKTGRIRPLNGQLIVNHTAEAQRAIYNFIQLQRRARTVQLTIETRLLEADATALKKIRAIAPMDRHGEKQDGAPEGYCAIDDFDLERLLSLLKEDPSIKTATSPRMTVFLGAEVVTRVGGEEVNRVVGWKKEDEGYQPVTEEVYNGVELAMLPALSADGRTIDFDLDLLLNHVAGEPAVPSADQPGVTQKLTKAHIAGKFSLREGWSLMALGPDVDPVIPPTGAGAPPTHRRFVLIIRTRLMLPRLEDYPLEADDGGGVIHLVM